MFVQKSGEGKGAGARENRGREGTGDGRRKGGKRDLLDGGKREKLKKASFRYLLLLIIQSKKRTQQRFLTSI